MQKTKDIVLICDDNYCIPTAVCIQSIIDNYTRDLCGLTVHVCTFGLLESNINLLRRLSTADVCVEINNFDLANYQERINCIIQKSHVTPSALIKFEIANYFKNIDSILYFDSDMVVKGDITELLNVDIGDSYVAATYEFYNHINIISYSLKRSVSKVFNFNSGVMLFNLLKMRNDNVPEKLWDYKLNKAKTTLMDQESLNAICAATAIRLPIKWNFNPLFLQQSYLREINRVYNTTYDSLKQLEQDVRIVHYVGSTDKPWKYLHSHMREYWDVYYFKVFKDEKLSLIEVENVKRTYLDAIRDKFKKHGLNGLICNMIYNLSVKIRNAR